MKPCDTVFSSFESTNCLSLCVSRCHGLRWDLRPVLTYPLFSIIQNWSFPIEIAQLDQARALLSGRAARAFKKSAVVHRQNSIRTDS